MTEDKYEVRPCVPEAAIRVSRSADPQLSLKVTLSSLAMRDERGSREEGTGAAPPPRLLYSQHLHPLYLTRGGWGRTRARAGEGKRGEKDLV